MFEKLEETFNLAPVKMKYDEVTDAVMVIDENQEVKGEVSPSEMNEEKDLQFVRDTYKRMIEKSENILDDMISIARSSEHPNAYKTASDIVKTIGDMAGKLEAMYTGGEGVGKKKRGVPKETPQTQNTQVNNNLFVGTTDELMKLIRGE